MTNIYENSAQCAWEAVLAKVKELEASGVKRAEISRKLGHKGRSAVTNWLEGTTTASNASFPDMLRYLDVLGLNIQDFLPSTPVIQRPAPYAPVEVVKGEDLPEIPVIGSTGARNDVELFNASPSYWINILPQYMRPGLVGLIVEGDSMEPTVHKGAIVGIVPYDGSINEGGIYLVHRPPFGRTIKRIKMDEEGHLVMHSDNASYAPAIIPDEGYEKILMGRVVWVWQTL